MKSLAISESYHESYSSFGIEKNAIPLSENYIGCLLNFPFILMSIHFWLGLKILNFPTQKLKLDELKVPFFPSVRMTSRAPLRVLGL